MGERDKHHPAWLGALINFRNPKRESGKGLDRPSAMLFAARSLILIISAQAAAIAGILAYLAGRFNLLYFIVLLIGFLSLHMASNLSNDYFGYKQGHDTQ